MDKESLLGEPALKGRYSYEQESEKARNEGGPCLRAETKAI